MIFMAKKRIVYRYSRHRKPRRRSNGGMTLPIAPIAGLAVGIGPGIMTAVSGDTWNGMNMIVRGFTGFDINSHDFSYGRMIEGVVPLVIGLLVHKFVGGRPFNANAALAKAKVPFIRI